MFGLVSPCLNGAGERGGNCASMRKRIKPRARPDDRSDARHIRARRKCRHSQDRDSPPGSPCVKRPKPEDRECTFTRIRKDRMQGRPPHCPGSAVIRCNSLMEISRPYRYHNFNMLLCINAGSKPCKLRGLSHPVTSKTIPSRCVAAIFIDDMHVDRVSPSL